MAMQVVLALLRPLLVGRVPLLNHNGQLAQQFPRHADGCLKALLSGTFCKLMPELAGLVRRCGRLASLFRKCALPLGTLLS